MVFGLVFFVSLWEIFLCPIGPVNTVKKEKITFASYSTPQTRQVVSRCSKTNFPLIQKMQRLCQPY